MRQMAWLATLLLLLLLSVADADDSGAAALAVLCGWDDSKFIMPEGDTVVRHMHRSRDVECALQPPQALVAHYSDPVSSCSNSSEPQQQLLQLPARLVVKDGHASRLVLQGLSLTLPCSSLSAFQRLGCWMQPSLDVQVRDDQVYVKHWQSSHIKLQDVTLTCSASSSEPLPLPQCVSAAAASPQAILEALQTLQRPPAQRQHVFIVLSANLTWLADPEWPAGGADVWQNVTLAGDPRPGHHTEIDFGLQTDLFRLHASGHLELRHLVLTNMPLGPASHMPRAMLPAIFWFCNFDEGRSASSREQVAAVLSTVVVPADVFEYLSYWISIANSPLPHISETAHWLSHSMFGAMEVGYGTADSVMFVYRTSFGATWRHVVWTPIPPPGAATPMLTSSGLTSLLANDAFVPLSAVNNVACAEQLRAALTDPHGASYHLLANNISLLDALSGPNSGGGGGGDAADGATAPSALPGGGVCGGGGAAPAAVVLRRNLTLLGAAGSHTVLDLGGCPGLVELAADVQLTLRHLTLVNAGPAGGVAATTASSGDQQHTIDGTAAPELATGVGSGDAGAIDMRQLSNFSSLLWTFRSERSQRCIILQEVTLVLPAAEVQALQRVVHSGTPVSPMLSPEANQYIAGFLIHSRIDSSSDEQMHLVSVAPYRLVTGTNVLLTSASAAGLSHLCADAPDVALGDYVPPLSRFWHAVAVCATVLVGMVSLLLREKLYSRRLADDFLRDSSLSEFKQRQLQEEKEKAENMMKTMSEERAQMVREQLALQAELDSLMVGYTPAAIIDTGTPADKIMLVLDKLLRGEKPCMVDIVSVQHIIQSGDNIYQPSVHMAKQILMDKTLEDDVSMALFATLGKANESHGSSISSRQNSICDTGLVLLPTQTISNRMSIRQASVCDQGSFLSALNDYHKGASSPKNGILRTMSHVEPLNVWSTLTAVEEGAEDGCSRSGSIIPQPVSPNEEPAVDSGHLDEEEVPADFNLQISIVPEVERLLATCAKWHFDMAEFSAATDNHPLSTLAFFLFQNEGLITFFNLDALLLSRFLRRVEEEYLDRPYHNKAHAADVLHFLHVLIKVGGLEPGYMDPMYMLSCYLAAAIHDLGHLGLTNDFLISTSNILALSYNDRAPLENHHLVTAFMLMHQEDYAFHAAMNKSDRDKLRKNVIDLVLGTDMKQHFTITGQFRNVHQLASGANKTLGDSITTLSRSGAGKSFSGEVSNLLEEDVMPLDDAERLLSLQMALKCADIGHTCAQLTPHLRSVACLEEEFFQQGDQERALNVPISPLFDRTKPGVTKSQVGFFDFVVIPLYSSYTSRFPKSKPILTFCMRNYKYWKEQSDAAASPSATD